MKTLTLILILMLPVIGCNSQNKGTAVIESFVKMTRENSSFKNLLDKGVVASSVDENSIEAYSAYEVILKALRNELELCQQSNSKYEILTVEESIARKGYGNDDLLSPNAGGEVYLLYCKEKIITFFLVKDSRIVSFSTLSKGERKVFLIL